MKSKDQMKSFQVRMKKENWIFLKRVAANQERSMANIIESCVEKYKKKLENKLTDGDTMVS